MASTDELSEYKDIDNIDKQYENDDDQIEKLQRQLSETEEKLVKFKKFALSLRNDRDQLNDKLKNTENDNEKLRQELKKFQNKNYNQVFTNFQNLQLEYDKQQDIIEDGKRKNKSLEQDLFKCGEDLSNCKNQIAQQIEELHQSKSQLQQKDQQIQSLQASKQDLESKIIVLQQENKDDKKHANDLQNSQIDEYDKKINVLQEVNENLRLQLAEKDKRLKNFCETDEKYSDLKEQFDQILCHNQELKDNFDEIQEKYQNIHSEKIQFEEEFNILKEKHSQKCLEHEQNKAELEKKLKHANDDIEECNSKFEQYKIKVANVLKEGKLNSAEHDKALEDVKFENEKAHQEIDELRSKCAKSLTELTNSARHNSELEQKLKLFEIEIEQYQSTKTRLNELIIENTRLNSKIEHGNLCALKELKEKENIQETCNNKIDELKQKYEEQIRHLEQELQNTLRQPSPVCVVPMSPVHISDTESANNSVIHSFVEINGREDISQQSSNNSSGERNFLEDILNNDSDNQSIDLISASEIEKSTQMLTQMLGDSENNIQLLSEQNRVLKEEIRRLTKNIERMDIAENLEYLKNVLLKFMTINKIDERERLITVLTTILKLTQDERRIFVDAIQNGQSSAGNFKWSIW